MNDQQHDIGRLAYERSTHAPLAERYIAGEFRQVGLDGEFDVPWRIHEETGAEIHALGGANHEYNKDWRVGHSYPATVFVFADRAGDTRSASHDDLEAFLREHGLWSDKLVPVAVPDGAADWRFGFQYRPPEASPYGLDGRAEKIARTFDLDDHAILGGPNGFQAMLG